MKNIRFHIKNHSFHDFTLNFYRSLQIFLIHIKTLLLLLLLSVTQLTDSKMNSVHIKTGLFSALKKEGNPQKIK